MKKMILIISILVIFGAVTLVNMDTPKAEANRCELNTSNTLSTMQSIKANIAKVDNDNKVQKTKDIQTKASKKIKHKKESKNDSVAYMVTYIGENGCAEDLEGELDNGKWHRVNKNTNANWYKTFKKNNKTYKLGYIGNITDDETDKMIIDNFDKKDLTNTEQTDNVVVDGSIESMEETECTL